MKQMNDAHLTYFEKRLTAEIDELTRQIRELETERQALRRQLAKAQAQRSGLQYVTRKNSTNRVLAENSVLQMLRDEKKPVHTRRLYKNALMSNGSLKENTFRTYLHRMKNKGLIKVSWQVGVWELSPSSE